MISFISHFLDRYKVNSFIASIFEFFDTTTPKFIIVANKLNPNLAEIIFHLI
jgi:hypothetical protein